MNILILDDELNILRTTTVALKSLGHNPFTAENISAGRKILERERIDVLFLDLMLGDENGIDYIEDFKENFPDLVIIVFTAHSTVESAVESIKRGASEYIQKPFIPDEIDQLLNRIEKGLQLQRKVAELESQVAEANPTIILDSNEPNMQEVFGMAFKAAASEANILLLGPSCTGKTVLARNIHSRSNRHDRNFVTVHCPSLSKELLESELFGHVKGAFTGAVKETWGKVAAAEGGTLFLDEIGELPIEIQPKLLRLLQDREYERVGDSQIRQCNIRLLAATNRNLEEAVEEGRFREDLYYRLKVIPLQIPPLSERPSDILPLAENYLHFFGAREGRPSLCFTEDARERILNYEWVGNLREMRNVIERAIILSDSDSITAADLPAEFHENEETAIRPGHSVTLQQLEEEHIRRVVAKAPSLDQAARILGIDSATLYRKRKKMGLS